jgi:excisionase family DNA binding protein
MADPEEQLTLPQVAHLLDLNPSTIRLWVNEQRLPAERVGRRWMVRRRDLEKMLADQPKIGHPKRRGATPRPARAELPADWSEVPEEAGLYLARSTEPIEGAR